MSKSMINTKVVDTDAFLEMPSTSRLLYYDLLIRADNDGFITPLKVIRLTGASPDDLKMLVTKRFAYAWEDGVIVLLHYREHNHVKHYVPSDYWPRLRDLGDKYALGARQVGAMLAPVRLHPGANMAPQDRIGKDSINNTTPLTPQGGGECLEAWKVIVGTTLRSSLKAQESAAARLKAELGSDRVKELLMAVRILRADKHAPRNIQIGITNFVSMEKHLEALEAYAASKLDQSMMDNRILEAS